MENRRKIYKKILAIDPGDVLSAYVIMDAKTYKPYKIGLIPNEEMIKILRTEEFDFMAIEMIASYGMPVGKSIFDTCVWIGRFIETVVFRNISYEQIYRLEEKLTICFSVKANDSNIRQALIDRFGVVGTKKNPGFFYGFKKDIWAAFAVGCTFLDKRKAKT